MTTPSVFVALDTTDPCAAERLAAELRGHVGGVKLGLEFFSANGFKGVERVQRTGLPVFLDLKLHDIPNTVAGAVRALLLLEPALLTVHAAGGPAMLKAAADAARERRSGHTRVIAVTVLTSLDDRDLEDVGQRGPAREQVLRLADLARNAGVDGVVSSPLEVAAVRARCGTDFTLVVPGIRPADAGRDDQKRVMTPREAVAAGADILVVGRPITAADDPVAAARSIAIRDRSGTAVTVAAKICGINAPAALAAAVEGGARFVGFVFYPRSPRYVTPVEAGALARATPSGVTRVGLFVDVDDDSIAAILEAAPLDMLQFHGAESPDRIRATKARFGLPVMKAIKIGQAADRDAATPFLDSADWLLFDAKVPSSMTGALPGGNALAFDWRLLAGMRVALPWMLSGGLTGANVAEAVRTSGARTVDVSSGVEDRPGHKDPARIAEFLRIVRAL